MLYRGVPYLTGSFLQLLQVGEGDGDDAEDRPEPPKKTAKKRKATG